MINWYKKVVFENFVNFKGRARRSELWYSLLLHIIFCVLFAVIDNLAGTTIKPLPYGTFYMLYALIVLIPGLAVQVRRLHDIGKSGWFWFIVCIPFIGAIWLLILYCKAGEEGANKWGANPKLAGVEIDKMGNE